MAQKLVRCYTSWLTMTSGPREMPNILGVFTFAALAFLIALLTGLPAFYALSHGASAQGSFQWQAKDGRMVSMPIQPLATIDAVVIVVSVAFLSSGVAFCFGWLDRFSE